MDGPEYAESAAKRYGSHFVSTDDGRDHGMDLLEMLDVAHECKHGKVPMENCSLCVLDEQDALRKSAEVARERYAEVFEPVSPGKPSAPPPETGPRLPMPSVKRKGIKKASKPTQLERLERFRQQF